VNHLWSDWQLGVCEFILIPVSAADEHCSHTQTTAVNNVEAQSSTAPCELVTRHELVARNKLPKSASVGRIVADDTESKTVSSDVQQTNSISVQDYFSKYDSSLAKIRQNVHRMEQTMKSAPFYLFTCLLTYLLSYLLHYLLNYSSIYYFNAIYCKPQYRRSTFGTRAFLVASLTAWISLPDSLQSGGKVSFPFTVKQLIIFVCPHIRPPISSLKELYA